MLPEINGKSFLECTEDDLKLIIGNPDFRENEHLEYKETFSFLVCEKEKKPERIAEFRSDVCAFANADGGYLFFGIKEDGHGIPDVINGIPVDNPERFEREIGDKLTPVNPRRPNISFNFVRLENGNYVVIIYVRHDAFSPYVHLENVKDYRIYKRYGNSKVVASYADVRNMFTQAVVLEKEIEQFRKERIDYYSQMGDDSKTYRQFMMLHIFPESFLDNSYDQPLFVLERKKHPFSSIFSKFCCYDGSIPMVEGLRFPGNSDETEGRLFNNGVAEFFYSLSPIFCGDFCPKEKSFSWEYYWEIIEGSISSYLIQLQGIFQVEKLYVGFSLIGLKNIISDYSTHGMNAKIDRDKLIMNTIAIDCNNEESLSLGIKRMKLDYLLSLGIKYNKVINELISEIHEG